MKLKRILRQIIVYPLLDLITNDYTLTEFEIYK